MKQPIALITNATQFAGPPATRGLLDEGMHVFVHDRSFADGTVRARYAAEHDATHVLAAQAAEDVVRELLGETGALDVIVSNDAYPAVVGSIEDADPHELTQTLEALVGFPYRLIRSALAALKRSGQPRVVFVTSNRTRLPVPGGAIPDSARAAANALVKSLSVELAPLGIPVNSVAPNFLYSEAYYPRAVFVESKAGRDFVSANVPAGRLADPAEIGEVIRFLATARTTFMTGAIIDFSGGWPAGTTLAK
jgi:NAD(P)-dependent dehydrogenase (short-subunit alcohol dehydrogenase family)